MLAIIVFALKISTVCSDAMIFFTPYQSAIRTMVPRFHGSLMPSRSSVNCPEKSAGGSFFGISTTIIPSRFEESEEIFFNSDSDTISTGKVFCKGFKKSSTKNPSTMRKSDCTTSKIDFFPSTTNRPNSARVLRF